MSSYTAKPDGLPHRKISWEWTADDDGNVELATTYGNRGFAYQVEFVNATGGDQPTTGYDVTIDNEDGTDVLLGLGADVASAANSLVHIATDGALTPVLIIGDKLTLNIANAGAGKKGTVHLYLAE